MRTRPKPSSTFTRRPRRSLPYRETIVSLSIGVTFLTLVSMAYALPSGSRAWSRRSDRRRGRRRACGQHLVAILLAFRRREQEHQVLMCCSHPTCTRRSQCGTCRRMPRSRGSPWTGTRRGSARAEHARSTALEVRPTRGLPPNVAASRRLPATRETRARPDPDLLRRPRAREPARPTNRHVVGDLAGAGFADVERRDVRDTFGW
jgi:hypothetical protein